MIDQNSALRLALISAVVTSTGCSSKDITPPREHASAVHRQRAGASAEATTRTDVEASTLDAACARLAAERPLPAGGASVLAARCAPSADLTARDVYGLVLTAWTPPQARDLLQRIQRWGDNEATRLVSLLLATEQIVMRDGDDGDDGDDALAWSVPHPAEIAVIPMTDAHVALAGHLYSLTNDPAADDVQKTTAHAALATVFLQVFDSLGVRDMRPLPPLARLVGARFLTHGRAFAIAHLRERVAGLHPALLQLEPEMAAVVALLARDPMGGADGAIASAWILGHRYLRISEVRARLGGRARLPWRVAVRRLLDLRMPRLARALLAKEFPVAAGNGVLDAWLDEVAPPTTYAPRLRELAAAPQSMGTPVAPADADTLPEALADFHRQTKNERRARGDAIEGALIRGARGRHLSAALAWAEHEGALLDDPELLRGLIQRAGTTPALRIYRPVLIEAARRVSLRPELHRDALDTLEGDARVPG